jgi:heat shock protein 4
LFPLGNPIPSTKAISVFRKDPFELSIDYANVDLLPPQTKTHLATVAVPAIPNAKDPEPKIKIRVKLDVNAIVSIEGAELIDTVEEEVPASSPTPAPATTTASPPPTTEGEKKAEGESTPAEQTAPPPTEQQPAAAPIKKKKVLKTELPLKSAASGSLDEQVISGFRELELKMVQVDRLVTETAEAKNAVESYVYNIRSKLSGPLGDFVNKDDVEKFQKMLSDTEEWLYGEGEDSTKSVYVAKSVALRSIGDPIERRKFEHDERYSTLESVRKTIANAKLAATSAVSFRKGKVTDTKLCYLTYSSS